MVNHGVYVSQQPTSVSAPAVADSGIPFVIGAAPIQAADAPGKVGVPVLCTSWDEAVKKLGYSDDWKSYPLCEFMYSHFKLFGAQPAIFCNVLAPASMKESVSAAEITVTDHKASLPVAAIDGEALVVKPQGGSGGALVKGVDYSTYYHDEALVVELLEDSDSYGNSTLNIAYDKVSPNRVDKTVVATGMEAIENCLTLFGLVPDLICAPGLSGDSTVAAVMATKAAGINGLFPAKALIDIDTATATTYENAISGKASANLVDVNQILCWPKLRLGDKVFHMSTQLAGLMAQVDTNNGGCPYESPSNKGLKCDSAVLADGTEVLLTINQANILNSNGINTALNFMGGWVAWGNYTACFPTNTDIKDHFIPVSRMFGWITTTLIKTFWSKLDKPMTRRLADNILDTCNIWLNGLVGSEYLLGARAVMLEEENPLTSLMAGTVKFHLYITPPTPAQEIDFVLEIDVEYIKSALAG